MDISTLFTQAACKWPQALAIKDLRSQRELTFAELNHALDDFGAGLEELGVGKGERVALLADTSLDYLLADYGCMAHGRVRVPLDPSLAPSELLAQIKDAGARVLLFGTGHSRVAATLIEQGVVCLALDEVRVQRPADAPARDAQARTGLASLNYTGGTTGAPKAVMHTHASLCAVLQNIVMARAALPGDVLLNVRPLWPIAAVALLAHLLSGGQLTLVERFEASTFVSQLQQHRAAFSSLVPTQLLRVLREPSLAEPDLSTLKSIDIGAAAIAPSVLDDACQLFGPRLSVLYGMTEAPWTCYLSAAHMGQLRRNGESAEGLVGRPVFAAGLRIDRPDDQGMGEIMLAGPQLMAGYWQQPELSANVLQDGWLRSGDLGRIRADGHLQVMGRSKEIIRSGGKSIQPGEVIECLLAHPQVADAHVFGLADLEWGERVCAAVVLKPGTEACGEQLQSHCQQLLSRFKVPRQVYFVATLPRSHYGKIQLNRLLEQLG
ncbi:class I adenylate-forming enzyme family protein [Pseudomonas sp. CCC3.1]|uniref:class I adenylate-forming enzyme family protein n=1 Tax=Pseudomonas sp. CCC3.1 TaxID=3048607 RepID=UPI002AC8EF6F|nr:AMP-binding protein [Pseudomonas sp. CCC3.1]MEB0204373.1 AMP-binding protein [Pseudomonas sp. CCC3.1]WPX38507.1 AMP-binding protein [Pseudomonas sp. CCC3.1]